MLQIKYLIMIKVNTYSQSGVKTSMPYPKALEEKENLDLLAQAIRVYQDRSHPGLSKVRTRSDVDLTTAKVWRQKGTGRARHGARSAPIFVGGGVAHGPKGVKRTLEMSQKMAKKAFLIALTLKAKKGNLVVVKDLSKISKTLDAQKLIDKIISKQDIKSKVNISLVIEKDNLQTRKAFRNIGNVNVLNCGNLGMLDIYLGGLLIFESKAFDKFVKIKTSAGGEVEKKKGNTEKTEVAEGTEKAVAKDAEKANGAGRKRASKGVKSVRKSKSKGGVSK